MRFIVAFVAFIFAAQFCHAWSTGGHHLIAVMAYELSEPAVQAELLEILSAHPSYKYKFEAPENTRNNEHWLIGRAATWPDLVRGQHWDRPTWHYQLGATLVLDEVPDVPNPDFTLPTGANLATLDLHIVQAIEMNRQILNDKSQRKVDRAIALCWLLHLVADLHQPCHGGSLYSKEFPNSDRGANEILTKQRKKLHAVWDGLLGPTYDEGDIARRRKELMEDELIAGTAEVRSDSPVEVWMAESRELGMLHVYTPEVIEWVQDRKPGIESDPLVLSNAYLREAGSVARLQAIIAAYRLAKILSDSRK